MRLQIRFTLRMQILVQILPRLQTIDTYTITSYQNKWEKMRGQHFYLLLCLTVYVVTYENKFMMNIITLKNIIVT